jgi:hypothetical protein
MTKTKEEALADLDMTPGGGYGTAASLRDEYLVKSPELAEEEWTP